MRIDSDKVSEWLKRRPAKPLGSARAGSNPVFVVSETILFITRVFEMVIISVL